MELLLTKRVVCEFKGVAVDPDGYVVARLKPEDGGQKAIEKWANHLHIEMELAEPPKFATFRGAVQIWLKPQDMVRLPKYHRANLRHLRSVLRRTHHRTPEPSVIKSESATDSPEITNGQWIQARPKEVVRSSPKT
jgi:hypothetical protein